MPKGSKTLEGYIKTSNMYLIGLLTLAVGFLGGVLFSSYRMTSITPAPAPTGMPAPSQSAGVPLTKDQSDKIAALVEATKATPDNVKVWTELGNLYFDSGKFSEAVQAYEKSLSLDAERPDVWTDLGVMYRRSGKPKKAIESFERALSINNRHEIAMFNKGVVLMHDLSDSKAAIAAWEALVQANPDAKAPNGQPIKLMLNELKNQ